jgi:Integrase core domain
MSGRAEGWLYVAAVVDLFSRRVVGWSMSAEMTAQLVTDALVMAIWRRGKPDALLHHSDRGNQYTSEQFQRLMTDHGVVFRQGGQDALYPALSGEWEVPVTRNAMITPVNEGGWGRARERADVARARRRWIREQGFLDPASAAFSASSWLLGLKSETTRFKSKTISAAIAVDVKRFCRQIKTDGVSVHTGVTHGYGSIRIRKPLLYLRDLGCDR